MSILKHLKPMGGARLDTCQIHKSCFILPDLRFSWNLLVNPNIFVVLSQGGVLCWYTSWKFNPIQLILPNNSCLESIWKPTFWGSFIFVQEYEEQWYHWCTSCLLFHTHQDYVSEFHQQRFDRTTPELMVCANKHGPTGLHWKCSDGRNSIILVDYDCHHIFVSRMPELPCYMFIEESLE